MCPQSFFFFYLQPHRALRSDYVGMQSSQSDDHTTLLECANNDTVVTVEPPIGRNEEDSLSSISDVPTVAHFNISVRDIYTMLVNYI